MKYSVYDYGRRRFDYYEDGRTGPTHAPAPKRIAMSGVGAIPEHAAWSLPAGAKKVGSGEMPMGRIAGASSMGGISVDDPMTVIAAGALAYFAWRIFK